MEGAYSSLWLAIELDMESEHEHSEQITSLVTVPLLETRSAMFLE